MNISKALEKVVNNMPSSSEKRRDVLPDKINLSLDSGSLIYNFGLRVNIRLM